MPSEKKSASARKFLQKGEGRGGPRRDIRGPDGKINVAQSIRVAASSWGIETNVLTWAKLAGCPAFRSNRIYRDELEEWIGENPPPPPSDETDPSKMSKDDLERLRLSLQCEGLRTKNEKEKGLAIPKLTVREEWARGVAIIFEEARSLMATDIYAVFAKRCKTRLKETP